MAFLYLGQRLRLPNSLAIPVKNTIEIWRIAIEMKAWSVIKLMLEGAGKGCSVEFPSPLLGQEAEPFAACQDRSRPWWARGRWSRGHDSESL